MAAASAESAEREHEEGEEDASLLEGSDEDTSSEDVDDTDPEAGEDRTCTNTPDSVFISTWEFEINTFGYDGDDSLKKGEEDASLLEGSDEDTSSEDGDNNDPAPDFFSTWGSIFGGPVTDVFLEFFREHQGWDDADFGQNDDDAPIEDTAALDTMVGLYTPTQFHDERLRKDGTPLDYYDERLSDRWLATPSCRDGYLRVEPEAEALELPGFEGKTLYKLAANRIFVPAVRPEFESWVKDIAKDLPAFCAQLRPGGPPGAAPICLFPKVVDSPLEFFAMESGQRYGMYGSNIMVPDLETRCGRVFTSGLESGQRYGTYEAFRPFSPVWRDTLAQVANLAARYGIFQVFQAQDISRVRAFLDFWGGRFAHRFRFQSAWMETYSSAHAEKARATMRTIYDPITAENSWMPRWFIAILNTLATAVNKDAPLA